MLTLVNKAKFTFVPNESNYSGLLSFLWWEGRERRIYHTGETV